MKTRLLLIFCLLAVGVAGCASTTATANREVKPGMSAAQVSQMLGEPDGREFRDDFEAWRYHDVVGFGQCEYITIFLREEQVVNMTSRRGFSAAGCGLGSGRVAWSLVGFDEDSKPPANAVAPTTDATSPDANSSTTQRMQRYEELERLTELLDKGVLTREEYEAEKAKILSD